MVTLALMKLGFPRIKQLVRFDDFLESKSLAHLDETAIVDGSGVLYDPAGLNREELLRLATKRLMISHFDVSLLSPKGFRVLVDETFVRLPGNIPLSLSLG